MERQLLQVEDSGKLKVVFFLCFLFNLAKQADSFKAFIGII